MLSSTIMKSMSENISQLVNVDKPHQETRKFNLIVDLMSLSSHLTRSNKASMVENKMSHYMELFNRCSGSQPVVAC